MMHGQKKHQVVFTISCLPVIDTRVNFKLKFLFNSSNFTNILKIQKRTEIWDKLYISISLYYITFINKN